MNEEYCHFCGRPATDMHHMLHGTGMRKLADRYKLLVPLCHSCHMRLHDTGWKDRETQAEGQRIAMERNGWTTDDFIKVFGKNYINN